MSISKVDQLFLGPIQIMIDSSICDKRRDNAKMELNKVLSALSKKTFSKTNLGGLQAVAHLKWKATLGKNNHRDLLLAYCYLKISMAKANQLVKAVWKSQPSERVKKFSFSQKEVLERFTKRLSDRIIEVQLKISSIENYSFSKNKSYF